MYTSEDIFSIDAFNSFKKIFTQKKDAIVSGQPYSKGDPSSVQTALNNVLQSQPDGILFAGYAADAGPLLSLPQIANLLPQFKILGGSGMADLSNYPDDQPKMERLSLTSLASQDEWQFLHADQLPQISEFNKNYQTIFKSNTFGPNVPLLYDAVNVLLEGYRMALANGGSDTCLPCAVQKALQSMNGTQAWQGVTGQIAFTDKSTEPVDKVLLINVIQNRTTKTIASRGCFRVDRTDCKN